MSGQHSPVPSEQQGMQHIQSEGVHEAFLHTRPLWFAERRWWSPGVAQVSLHQQMPGQHFMYKKKKKEFQLGTYCWNILSVKVILATNYFTGSICLCPVLMEDTTQTCS